MANEEKVKPHKRIIEKTVAFRNEFKNQVSTAMLAAFGFLIALVWRDFIEIIVKGSVSIEMLEVYPYLAAFYTAVVVTVIAIIGIFLVSRWAKKEEK
jgi:hypothetical protein